MMKNGSAYLLIEKGEPYHPQEIFPLLRDKILIGRGWGNHLPELAFSDQAISRGHAEIFLKNGRYYIRDFSKNGTKIIDGPRLEEDGAYELKHGNRISLAGGRVVLAFYIGVPTGETVPTPQNSIEILLDEKRRLVTIEGRELFLSHQPYLLFKLLYDNRGEVVGHQTIIKTIWPGEDGILRGSEEITSLIKRLRYELGDNNLIKTVPKSGYILK
jgi:pSer/pThr/pTyr-binding forkhead associated (FHA) protein